MAKVAKVIPNMILGLAVGFGLSLSAAQAGDAAAGAGIYKKKCKTCHTIDAGGKNKIGPNLHGVVDKTAAAVEGYKYSPAMKAAGLTWTEENLTEFLTKPKKFVPKTKMGFGGLKKPEQIEDLIAFLKENS